MIHLEKKQEAVIKGQCKNLKNKVKCACYMHISASERAFNACEYLSVLPASIFRHGGQVRNFIFKPKSQHLRREKGYKRILMSTAYFYSLI